ncbi:MULTISPECIES: hypothetical protein [Rufibacter]|uniref:Uncharacterized protein n=1 Tax=Rufibacter quisquiliarum TaxID=1549639 RepID=A0A839GQR2_9BACT|nr:MULTISPECIES: hypothetical protein [Rufibacter]MBA9077216.1 hypothetical protein [Rufibacter quisquiliarum]
MDANQTTRSFSHLFKSPSQLFAALSNPGKAGMDLYKALSTREKQYVLFAAGAGLIVYGFVLGKQNK